MPEPRESQFPEGISDLLDLYRENQARDAALGACRKQLDLSCILMAPLVVKQLSRQIDHDLLCAEERELVEPKIRDAAWVVYYQMVEGSPEETGTLEIVKKWMQEARTEFGIRDSASDMIIEMLVERTWKLLCLLAPAERRNRAEKE